MTHGSLFSNIGGFDYAAKLCNIENVFHCEINPYGQQILKYHYPESITYGDITQTDFTIHRAQIDILTGGFPCQDASIAKQYGEGQKGLQGSRTGLFYEMCRAIREIRPKYIIAENVANILKTNKGSDFTAILTELSSMGYNAEWRICRASEVGATHHRARLYLVAYTNSIRLQQNESFFSYVSEKTSSFTWKPSRTSIQISRGSIWETEPPILCMDDGVSTKISRNRIMAYGNAIVPEIAIRIFKKIIEFEHKQNTSKSTKDI